MDINPQELQGLFRQIQVGFSSFYAKILEPTDLSFSQFAVLLCLARQQPQKMSQIASSLGVSLPAVTNLVDKLELRSLISRKPHPEDRRITLLKMTPHGKAIVIKTQGKTLDILTKTFFKHKASERKAIFQFLETLKNGMMQASQEQTR